MMTLRRNMFARDPDAIANLGTSLRNQAYALVPALLPYELLHALSADCDAAERAGKLRVAGTGRAAVRHIDEILRGDSILWLERASPDAAQTEFLDHLDALRLALNRELLLGLHEVEAHYAYYPAGAGYARHRDRFRDDDSRVLSLVIYLNEDWGAGDGGELRLHLPGGALDVLPELGTSVLFLSAEIEHEVRPATRARRSIAGWFRRRSGT